MCNYNKLDRPAYFFPHTKCLHCNRQIEGAGYSVGDPICGLLHLQCAPYYHFTPVWPHPFHKDYYEKNSYLAEPRSN